MKPLKQLIFLALGRSIGLFLFALLTFTLPSHAAGGYRAPDYMVGVQAYRQGDYASAAHYFKQVIRQDAANTNAHYYLGLTLDHLGKASEASAQYQLVIRSGRESELVHFAHERLNALASALPVMEPAHSQDLRHIQALTQAKSANSWIQESEQIAVPLKNNRNALMVDALLTQNLRTSTGAFIIDTGATYTSISRQMADHLGLDLENCEKVLITTANGRIEVPKITIETLNVNGLEAHNVEATVIPVRHGSSFSGLLGLSFIRQFVVTIDPQAGHLIFRRNSGSNAEAPF